jgi:transcriptional regulator with XRE-family HTH domain
MHLKRLKDLREDNDLTQKQLSEILNITRPQYSLYETGKRDIPVDLLRILSKYYKTSIDYIVGDTDISDRYPEKKEKTKR